MKPLRQLPGRVARFLLDTLRQNRFLTLLVAGTGLAVVFVAWKVILPVYKTPYNRTYTSGFGYAAVKHRLKIPFEIQTAPAQRRTLHRKLLGEGFMSSQSILVPVVPTDRIKAVYVTEGQRVHKGDLLAEIDSAKAELKQRSAELAIVTAEAEQERVEIGSAYVLAQERPEKDRIDEAAAQRQLELLRQQTEMYRKLENTGAISKLQTLETQKNIVENETALARSRFNLGMSSKGQLQSKLIAANTVAENQNVLRQRQLELKEHKIYAPADGLVERVLIQPGEYNQDSGKPAFVIASGLWFEAHFDQTSVGLVKNGDRAEVFLESLPGTCLVGTVTKVIPIVTYDVGGPELARPIRPSGSGAPEWPATYKVRIEMETGNLPLVTGLTGFARVSAERDALAVPCGAVLSISAGSGLVHVVQGQDHATRAVTFGVTDEGWTEITAGLAEGDKVITEGQLGLKPGDRILEVNPLTAGNGL